MRVVQTRLDENGKKIRVIRLKKKKKKLTQASYDV
jgi:hypothetical protein